MLNTIKLIRINILLLIIMVMFMGMAAATNSLWSDDAVNFYRDRDDYQLGDIVTVVIEEEASALQAANTDTSQSSSVEAEARPGIFGFLGSLLFGYSEEDSADGRTQRQGTFAAHISAEIVEIRDNGNVKIAGEKKITINEEDQTITLTGILRPEDIDLENKIPSERVANATIEYKGEGSIADKQRPGLFSRLFNWLF